MYNNQIDLENSNNLSGGNDSSMGVANMRNEPKLIISNYQLSPKMVEAGKDFDLAITLYNTNNQHAIYNLKVILNQTLQAQPQNQAGDNSSLVSDGSVFSPVDSSNTFYTQVIYPWNYYTQEITMNVLPNARAGSYVMGVTLEYEDYLGNKYQTTESIGIPVVQKAQITAGLVNIEDELISGNASSVSMNIYNTGKDNLSTFMIKVEGEGFSVDEDSRFIGNFAPGSTENFSFNITPEKEGKIEGKVVMTFEDSTGKEHRQEEKFEKEVISFGQDEMFDENGNPIITDPQTGEIISQEEMADSSFLTSPFTWIGLIVLIVLIIVFVKRKNKKKKNEELTIDED